MEIPSVLLHFFAIIGTIFTLTAAGHVVDFLNFHFNLPAEPLKAYKRRGPKPTYALITGGSAGIGYGIARALVKDGFGVILLGHKAEELAESAAALRALVPEDRRAQADDFVKIIVMDALTATPQEMEDKIRATVIDQELRVSILVNNVASIPIALPPFREQRTYSPDDIDNVIDLNARFMARLTTIMLPVLIHRAAGVDERGMSFGTHQRSLVLNMSSGGHVGLPWLVMYSATKAFNLGFSRALSRELEAVPETKHVDSLAVIPGDVRSQGNSQGVTEGAPDSDAYGAYIVDRVDGAVSRGWREMTPYWLHHAQAILIGLVPDRTFTQGALKTIIIKRDAFNAVNRPKDE